MGLFDQEDLSPDEPAATADVEKDHLFQTVKETSGSSRNYLKLLLIVAVFVAVAGAAIYYLTLPGPGDKILGPKGLEDQVRSHFKEKEKRNATDITFFQCEGFIWARVNVEKRPDIQTDPIYRIDRYRAKAVQLADNKWDISATPITADNMDIPCNY